MSEPGPIDEYKDLFENAPCGYLTIGPDGRISKVNATLEAWTGFSADKLIGQRLHQFLNMAGRIYFETHIAPLLRMQGFFSEFALDFETAAGERLPVIANAAERRNPDGTRPVYGPGRDQGDRSAALRTRTGEFEIGASKGACRRAGDGGIA